MNNTHKMLQIDDENFPIAYHNLTMQIVSKITSYLLPLGMLLSTFPLVAVDFDRTAEAREVIEQAKRIPTDLELDENRKPEQVLSFFNVRPGMLIADVFSGSGYYTSLFSSAVGHNGKVLAHNNQAYIDYLKEKMALRYADNRLANVERILAEANELTFDNNSLDMAFMFLAYHDIYYRPKKGKSNWPLIDRDDFLKRIYRGLKPGGTLGIIDHHALPGSDSSSGDRLHRIDVDLVIRELQAAGFVLQERAYFLENTNDDLSKHMYSPEVRGKTSRFVLKFIKPFDFQQPTRDEGLIP